MLFYFFIVFIIGKADTDWYGGTRKVSSCDTDKQAKIDGKCL